MHGETPRSIRLFEGLSLASLLLGLINVVAGLKVTWGMVIFGDGVMLALILLISRGQKNWARWLLAAMYALGLILLIGDAPPKVSTLQLVEWLIDGTMARGIPAVTLGVVLLQTIALVLLFTPRSAAWLRKGPSVADTFS
jgi:hypothetical protein